MANTRQAKKRVKQAVKRREHNQSLSSKFRTFVKNVHKAIATGDKAAATAAFDKAVPVIDSTASKGLIHKNKAARHKSRLNAKLKSL